jgi:serine/threonine protein kinase
LSSCFTLSTQCLILSLHKQLEGELRNTSKLKYQGIEAVLRGNYHSPAADAEAIISFLTSMLQVDPEKRLPAHELLHHPWLTGGVVQDKTIVGADQAEAKESDTDKALFGVHQTYSCYRASIDECMYAGCWWPSDKETQVKRSAAGWGVRR